MGGLMNGWGQFLMALTERLQRAGVARRYHEICTPAATTSARTNRVVDTSRILRKHRTTEKRRVIQLTHCLSVVILCIAHSPFQMLSSRLAKNVQPSPELTKVSILFSRKILLPNSLIYCNCGTVLYLLDPLEVTWARKTRHMTLGHKFFLMEKVTKLPWQPPT
jgi:hypothetical protein